MTTSGSPLDWMCSQWQAAVACSALAERQHLCEQLFQGGEEELGLLEAVKLLMLARALELHGRMQAGGDVPLFCWLLFARDSSDSPRSFLSNHLSHVGLSAGLEQVGNHSGRPGSLEELVIFFQNSQTAARLTSAA